MSDKATKATAAKGSEASPYKMPETQELLDLAISETNPFNEAPVVKPGKVSVHCWLAGGTKWVFANDIVSAANQCAKLRPSWMVAFIHVPEHGGWAISLGYNGGGQVTMAHYRLAGKSRTLYATAEGELMHLLGDAFVRYFSRAIAARNSKGKN